jgi:hypothetical protein
MFLNEINPGRSSPILLAVGMFDQPGEVWANHVI